MTNFIEKKSKVVLVTGGAGYLGSHTALHLVDAGYDVVLFDSLCNSSLEVVARIEEIAGRKVPFILGDVRNRSELDSVFSDFDISAVLHFAGLKSVKESIRCPLDYYDNNLYGTITLCEAMAAAHVFSIVFSSSATVYGEPRSVPISEVECADKPVNPYGRSKRMVENILSDIFDADDRWRIASLRYFNPIGAHESGLIGDNPKGTPNNLLPFLAKVAAGRLPELIVFGDNYPTHDGTGVRDYIHVTDLAEGHLRALGALESRTGIHIWNLGTGIGYSVLDVVRAFEKESGLKITCRTVGRRPGDIATSYADPAKAYNDLGWRAKLDLQAMVRDAWRWQSRNPDGY